MTKEYYNAFNPEESITGNHAGNCFQIEIHTGETTHSIELSLVDTIRMISVWEVDIENSLESRLLPSK